jgi:tRNA(fMet)-specific endonuclease VapC
MIYLLDTDIVIFMVRGLKSTRRPAQRQRAEWLVEHCRRWRATGDSVGISAVTVCELEYGARCSDQYALELAAFGKVLAPFDVYAFDVASGPQHYGRIRHELDSQGVPIGAMDLLIAAHAMALDATLVSNNLSHFSRIGGLKTADWLAPP